MASAECESIVPQEISVKWSGYGENLAEAVAGLHAGDVLTDVTLVAGDTSFPAHRLVLAANSELFRTIFHRTVAATVVVLHEVPAECVRALLLFMYRGEVRVQQQALPQLLRAADALRVCGLSAAAPRAQHTKDSTTPLTKKRKKEDDTNKIIKKPKQVEPSYPEVPVQHETSLLKCEPSESTVGGEDTSDSEVTGSPGDTRLIDEEVESVLQSVAVVENIAASTLTDTHTDGVNVAGDGGSGGGCSYESPSFPCPFCPRVYNSWGYRRRHVRSRHHTNRLSCKWCVCELESTGAWYGHTVRAHGAQHAAARDSLVVLVEAHAVLTLPPAAADPTPATLLRHHKR